MKFIIYGLADPITGEIRYIGKSSSGRDRAKAHGHALALLSDSNLHKARWIQGIRATGLDYNIVMLESVPEAESDPELLDEAERDWIATAWRLGWSLTNLTPGGDGGPGHKASAETRVKMSEAQRRRKRTPEEIAAFIGRNKLALAEGRRSKPELTPELRAAYSAAAQKANANRWSKPGAREAAAESMIGNKRADGFRHTEETKARIAASKTGQSNKGRLGQTNSPEHRLRIAEAQRQRHAANKEKRLARERMRILSMVRINLLGG